MSAALHVFQLVAAVLLMLSTGCESERPDASSTPAVQPRPQPQQAPPARAERPSLCLELEGPRRPVLLGESKVQELVAKAPDLVDLAPSWHMIGPLQSNKVNAALRWVSCVESVASVDLARRLAVRAAARDVPLDVMLQVNVSGEPTKQGVAPHEAVFVGDRFPEDVAGAQSVGMRGVWKERPDRERLTHVIPDAQIVHLRELLGILDSWTEGRGG